jgi:hypothetical protein
MKNKNKKFKFWSFLVKFIGESIGDKVSSQHNQFKSPKKCGIFFWAQNDHLYWLLTVQYLVQIGNYRIFGKYLEFLFFILIYLIFLGDLN